MGYRTNVLWTTSIAFASIAHNSRSFSPSIATNMQAPNRSIIQIHPAQTIMKTPLHHLEALAILAALTLLPHLADAASATWLVSPSSGNWEASASENNWSTGLGTWPGGTSTSSGDTATFNSGSTQTTITLNGSAWNVKNVTFDTANCAAYTINSTEGAAAARWTGGGAVTINSTVTQPQVFSGSQYRLHSGGGLSLINNSATPTATLTYSAGIKANNSTSANLFDQALNLQGTHTGNNTFSGVIADYATPAAGQWTSLTKSGTGTWYLTANNTYTGPTSITGGSLILSGSGAINGTTNVTISGSGAILSFNNAMNLTTANNSMTVNSSGTLRITNTVFQTPVSVATFLATNATLRLGVNGSTPFTNIVATTALGIGSTVTLAIDQVVSVPVAKTFDLISYTGADPAAGNFTVSAPSGYTGGAVTVDTVNKLVTVTVTPAVAASSLAWVGATNSVLISNWDTNTPNWVDLATRTIPQPYLNPDAVLFDDAALNDAVTLTLAVTPFGVTVNNSTRTYTFNGSGKISGSFGLTKQGSATLTLGETGGDDFSGGITNGGGTLILDDANCAISGGLGVAGGATVQIGQSDPNGALPAGNVDVEGTLIFSRSDNVTVTNAIFGAGSLIQNGNGTLTLNNTNGYTGTTTVSKGKLALAGAGTISNSVTLVVSNAAFDVSGIVGTTVLQALNITNATLNVGPTNTQTPISATSFVADGITGHSNLINVLALPPIASYPVTLTLIKSVNAITLTAGNFNFALGSLPSGSPPYAGSLSESGDGTAILLTLTNGPVGIRPSVTWAAIVNTSTDTNWSSRVNWQLPGAPVAADNVYFDGTTTVGANSTVNNVVDTSFTINSLTYNQNGASAFHVTQISDGQTLTVSGPVTVGNLPSADGTVTSTYMTGGGTFVANGTPFTVVNLGVNTGNSLATLDLSALSNFVYGNSSGTVNIANATSGNRFGGLLRLAGVSNNVTAGTINFLVTIASNGGNGSSGFQFGAGTNIINVGTFNMVASKNSGTIQFVAGAPSTAGLRLRGVNGNTDDSSRATIILGNRNTGGTGTTTGNLSLNGYPVDIKAGTITIGQDNQTGGNAATGTLSFDTGTVDATTINMGIAANAAVTGATGTINVGANAVLVIGSGGLSLVNQTAGIGTGNLNISGGTVICSNSIVKTTATGTGNITLSGGVLNMVSGTVGTPAARIDAVNLNDGSTLQLNVTAGVTNIVATAVNVSGTTTINIASLIGVTTRMQLPLISYNNSSSPIGGLVLGTIPARASNASLVDNTANQTIDLLITPPAPFVWVGAVGSTLNSAWNTSTLNWLDGATPSAYVDNSYVLFADNASNSVVTPATTVSPAGLTVSNNVLSYTFTGAAGKISGPSGLVKTGSGTLTLAETGGDNFSGGIAVNNGTVILDNANSSISGGAAIAGGATLQVGKNDGNGVLPSGTITVSGSLLFTQSVNQTVSNVIAGAGTLTQGGTNLLTLSGTNLFTGPAVVLAGSTLRLDNNAALGTADSGTTINSGGTLDVGAPDLAALALTVLEPITVSGAGVNGAGAILNSSTNQQYNALRYVTLAGDTTLGGPGAWAPTGSNPGRWDIRYSPTTGTNAVLSTSGQPYKLTKTGPNQVSIVGATVDAALGNIDIQQGVLGFEGGTTSMGNPASNLTVRAGATLSLYNTTNLWNKVFSLNGNGINPTITNWSGANTIIGPVTLNGECVLGVGGTSLTLSNNLLNGPGGLTKTAGGTLYLGSTNSFAGNATISAGTLALLDGSTLTNSPVITIAPGATLDVSARSTPTLALISGQTLFGAGTLTGGLAPAAGATVSPGTGVGVIGTMTASDTVSLQGTTYMEIAKTNTPATNDMLVANTLVEAGALYVTNLDAAHPPVSGDSFKLFSAVFYLGSGFSPITLPPLAAGLSWTNTLTTDGTISVIGTAASRPDITSISLSGMNVVISGTDAQAGTYYVLMSTNLAKPLIQWVPISTNVLSGDFTITVTNGVSASDPKRFYTLQAQ